MVNRCALRALAVLTLVLGLALTAMGRPDPDSFYPGDPPDYLTANSLNSQAKSELPDGDPWQSTIQARFQIVSEYKRLMETDAHPLVYAALKLKGEYQDYAEEAQKWKDDDEAYKVDLANYTAGIAGGVTEENKPFYDAWYQKLVDWKTRADAWGLRLVNQKKNLDAEYDDLKSKFEQAYTSWINDLREFNRMARYGITVSPIDRKLRELEPKLALDKRSLQDYQRQLPGFSADIEGFAEQAERDRVAGRDKAIEVGLSVAIDSMEANSASKEALTRSDLKRVKTILVSNGIPPDAAKLVLGDLQSLSPSVLSHHKAKEIFSGLGKLVDGLATADSATHRKVLEAVVTIAGLFLQTPELKLLKSNVEIWTSLLYTGASYTVARNRIKQFSALSDHQLKAVKALSDTYVKHIKLQKELLAQKAKAKEDFGYDS